MAKIKYDTARQSPRLEPLRPATDNQQLAIDYFNSKTLTILEGLAGTGKTYISVHYALQQFFSGQITKIILTRPLMNVGNEQVGFLPGEMDDKTRPYAEQFNEYMNEFLPQLNMSDEKKMQTGVEFIPLAYIRGRNFYNTVIIADEMQNASMLQVKTLLTRAAENTKIILLGDTKQSDRTAKDTNGLVDIVNRVKNKNISSIGVVTFTKEDIMRSGFVREVLELYGDI